MWLREINSHRNTGLAIMAGASSLSRQISSLWQRLSEHKILLSRWLLNNAAHSRDGMHFLVTAWDGFEVIYYNKRNPKAFFSSSVSIRGNVSGLLIASFRYGPPYSCICRLSWQAEITAWAISTFWDALLPIFTIWFVLLILVCSAWQPPTAESVSVDCQVLCGVKLEKNQEIILSWHFLRPQC